MRGLVFQVVLLLLQVCQRLCGLIDPGLLLLLGEVAREQVVSQPSDFVAEHCFEIADARRQRSSFS